MPQPRRTVHCKPVKAEPAVEETPTPVLTTVQDIGINSGTIVAGATVQTVNARRLHGFLQSKQNLSDWIKDRIEKYGFKAEKDYTTVNQKIMNNLGGRPTIEYHVSLDMAKSLAMVERTAKGQEARDYFIECEKKLLQVAPQAAPALAQSSASDSMDHHRYPTLP